MASVVARARRQRWPHAQGQHGNGRLALVEFAAGATQEQEADGHADGHVHSIGPIHN